jgi:8-oxo-dGTP diphosphatase
MFNSKLINNIQADYIIFTCYSDLMVEVKFYDPEFVPAVHLLFSVIAARFKDRWIFVRHKQRSTWEIPGGHIEEGESSDEAASRELMEETGAINFDIDRVATYSVYKDGKMGFGRLYYAGVVTMGRIPEGSEIAEVMFADDIPENLTWFDIQPHLFNRVVELLKSKG